MAMNFADLEDIFKLLLKSLKLNIPSMSLKFSKSKMIYNSYGILISSPP